MKPTLLVVSSVHLADDPRIREKLIRSLEGEWRIRFATGGPGPSVATGLVWVELAGGRLARSARAGALLIRGGYDLASIHDPELLPAALLARLLGRRVVFDLHENLPAQIRTKEWIPVMLRPPVARASAILLRIAERMMPITLAEAGYAGRFARPHPVFPNYPTGDELPERRAPDPDAGVVYLGDISAARGLETAVDAIARTSLSRIRLIGRCPPQFAARLEARAAAGKVRLDLEGHRPHREALDIVAGCLVGISPLRATPNYVDSLPTKVLEYLASGIPVVASDLPGTRDAIGHLPGVRLVPPDDVAAWAEAIERAATGEDHRREAAAAADIVRQRYVWPSDRVRSFYRGLLPAGSSD